MAKQVNKILLVLTELQADVVLQALDDFGRFDPDAVAYDIQQNLFAAIERAKMRNEQRGGDASQK